MGFFDKLQNKISEKKAELREEREELNSEQAFHSKAKELMRYYIQQGYKSKSAKEALELGLLNSYDVDFVEKANIDNVDETMFCYLLDNYNLVGRDGLLNALAHICMKPSLNFDIVTKLCESGDEDIVKVCSVLLDKGLNFDEDLLAISGDILPLEELYDLYNQYCSESV